MARQFPAPEPIVINGQRWPFRLHEFLDSIPAIDISGLTRVSDLCTQLGAVERGIGTDRHVEWGIVDLATFPFTALEGINWTEVEAQAQLWFNPARMARGSTYNITELVSGLPAQPVPRRSLPFV